MKLALLKKLINVIDDIVIPNPGIAIAYRVDIGGYILIKVCKDWYALHKVIVAFRENKWPDVVDHIDNNRTNNTSSNLRVATYRDNNCNRSMRSDNTLGYKGIFKRELKNRTVYGWMIKYAGYNESKSGFNTPEEAFKARCIALERAHGEYANNGEKKS